MWNGTIRELAACPNLHVTLGGLGMRMFGFTHHFGGVAAELGGIGCGAAALYRDLHYCFRPRARDV
jgi:hypothetical protein